MRTPNAPMMLFAATSFFVPACDGGGEGEEADPARVERISQLSGDVARGESLYQAQCSGCHGADGGGGSAPGVAGEDAEETIEASLEGPDDMPAYDHFEDQEIADLAAFVESL
jgi:mono/diheme cytochrome c family protein